MKKFYLILSALAVAASVHAGDIKFMLGDKTLSKGETIEFNEIEDDGYGTFVIKPDLAVIDTQATTSGSVVADCTTGQDIQMCCGGNCMRGSKVTKTGLTFAANKKLGLEFEYMDFMAESKDDLDKDITVNFTAEDGKGGSSTLVLVMNSSKGGVAAVLGDKPEVKLVGNLLIYKVNGTSTLSLHNILGVRAMQTVVSGSGSLNLNDLPKGIYVYSIQGDTSLSGKISIP